MSLLRRISSVLGTDFSARYKRIFSIEELEREEVLRWVFGASLLAFFLTFSSWIGSHALTIDAYLRGNLVCWEYFRSCGDIAFLRTLPEGYSQPFLYMGFFALMLLVVYCMHRKQWVAAHALLSTLFVWKFLAVFFLTRSFAANYDYYHLILTFILLFLPYKTFFLKFVFVLLYFLASTIKIHEGWILGSYFTSLESGLPLFPDSLTPVITGVVILMQMVGAWFLLSNDARLRIGVLVYFALFHLYSGLLVFYRYPTTVLPTLLILFGLFPSRTERPRGRKALPGWLFVLLLILLQLIPALIPRDQKLTLEGNLFGLFMFEANHQCVSTEVVYWDNGSSEEFVRESSNARYRCDPYEYWFRIHTACGRDQGIARISWTFDHSINGGPFYRLVNEGDACGLEYRSLQANDWIRTPAEGAPIIGYPVKNEYSVI